MTAEGGQSREARRLGRRLDRGAYFGGDRSGWRWVSDGLVISVSEVGGVTVLSVAGEIDLATAPNLRSALERTLRNEPRALVIDLTQIEFMASVGLQVLAEARAAVGDSFAVVADGSSTARPIRLTRLDEMIAVHSTLDDGLAAVNGRA